MDYDTTTTAITSIGGEVSRDGLFVNLRGTRVTGRAMEEVAGSLAQRLCLAHSIVSADVLARWLPEITHLRSLDLTGMKMTEQMLLVLESLHSIRELTLSHGEIGDAEVERLQRFSMMKKLGLLATKMTDESLNAIVLAMPNLQELSLAGSGCITDDGLDMLCGLKHLHLRRLCVTATGVTWQGRWKLWFALRLKCRIVG